MFVACSTYDDMYMLHASSGSDPRTSGSAQCGADAVGSPSIRDYRVGRAQIEGSQGSFDLRNHPAGDTTIRDPQCNVMAGHVSH